MQINKISEYQLISNAVLEFLPSIQTLIALEKRSSMVKKTKKKSNKDIFGYSHFRHISFRFASAETCKESAKTYYVRASSIKTYRCLLSAS